jgi:hypothetical protein
MIRSEDLKVLKEINETLSRIDYYEKRSKVDDKKQVVDQHSHEALFQKILRLYQTAHCAFLEISLPHWPHTVLYMDSEYEEVASDYIFPQPLIQRYRQEVGFSK